MSSFNDASCPKCGRRFGWRGSLVDKPACPKCGYKEDLASLQAAQAEMDAFKAELFKNAREVGSSTLENSIFSQFDMALLSSLRDDFKLHGKFMKVGVAKAIVLLAKKHDLATIADAIGCSVFNIREILGIKKEIT